jgi:putative flippase GtrA
MEKLLKKHAEKVKFIFVGGANTAIDFVILFGLTFLGVDKLVANFFSTSVALVFSFFVNKSFTFKNETKNAKKQFALFLVITLFGLWVIQPLVILGVTSLTESFITNSAISLFIAKLVATVASLIWNYIFYSRIVFKKEVK